MFAIGTDGSSKVAIGGSSVSGGGDYGTAGSGDGGDGGGFNKDVTKNAAGDAVRPGGVIDWGHHLGDVKQMTSGGQKGYDLLEHDVNQERAMAETRFDGKYFQSPHSAD